MEDNPNPNPNNDRDENERMSIDLPDSASNVQLLNMSETFQTPELRDLCRRLQRNDPELDSLEFENSGETPLGYGGPVGRALLFALVANYHFESPRAARIVGAVAAAVTAVPPVTVTPHQWTWCCFL